MRDIIIRGSGKINRVLFQVSLAHIILLWCLQEWAFVPKLLILDSDGFLRLEAFSEEKDILRFTIMGNSLKIMA